MLKNDLVVNKNLTIKKTDVFVNSENSEDWAKIIKNNLKTFSLGECEEYKNDFDYNLITSQTNKSYLIITDNTGDKKRIIKITVSELV